MMAPRIWTFPSCYNKKHLFQATHSSYFSVVQINPQNVFNATRCRTFCLSDLKIKKKGGTVCVYKLFVPLVLMHKSYSYTVNMLRAFYLHICVALSIHSQNTTYFESVTLTQLMLTLSCHLVHFKGLLKTSRDRIEGCGLGRA